MKHYLGIDLGGSSIATGVIKEDYSLVAKHSVPTGHPRPAEEIVRDMASAGKQVLAMAGLTEKDIDYVGIGVPSSVDQKNSHVIFANNLGWKDMDVAAMFRSYWDIPVFVANDADVAALGEMAVGAAKGMDSIILLTLGTGLGGGIIHNKQLNTGGDGFGTEPGHIKIEVDGEPCTCGARGCFECYASQMGLQRMTIRAIADHPDTIMRDMIQNDISKIAGRTAFDAAKKGDIAGKKVVDGFIKYLAYGVASLIDLLRPQMVIIGGGISNEGDELLFNPLRERVRPLIYGNDVIGVPPIVRAKLGSDAGIIGAALLGASI